MADASEVEFGFEQVFGFRPPTAEQSETAGENLAFKMEQDTDHVGVLAFFSAPELERISMEYIVAKAEYYAEQHGISRDEAAEIVFAGFIGGVELLATIRLMID